MGSAPRNLSVPSASAGELLSLPGALFCGKMIRDLANLSTAAVINMISTISVDPIGVSGWPTG